MTKHRIIAVSALAALAAVLTVGDAAAAEAADTAYDKDVCVVGNEPLQIVGICISDPLKPVGALIDTITVVDGI